MNGVRRKSTITTRRPIFVRTAAAALLSALSLGIMGSPLGGCEAFRKISHPEIVRPPGARPLTAEEESKLDDAQAARRAGNHEEALVLFQELLATNPTITTAYLGIGQIHMIEKAYEKAEPAFRRAARLEPRNFSAQYGHGLALQMLQQFGDAVRAYHRALTIEPENPKANLNLATTYLQMKEPERAVTFAERAVEADPASGPARANLGAIYEELGRNAEAVESYIAAIELMGNRPPLLMNLITVLIRENRYREAANTAASLVRIQPTAAGYERLGWCAFKLRQYDASLSAYRNAVEIDPEYWPALNGIGVNSLNRWLLSKKRDANSRSEARNAFRRSLRANRDQQKVVALMLNYSL